jgi:hypothetical protein
LIDPMLDDAAYQAKRIAAMSRNPCTAPLYVASFRVTPEEQARLAARLLAETAAWEPGKKYPALPVAIRRAIESERGSGEYKLAAERVGLPDVRIEEIV